VAKVQKRPPIAAMPTTKLYAVKIQICKNAPAKWFAPDVFALRLKKQNKV